MRFRFLGSAEWFTAPRDMHDPSAVARHAARLHGGARIGRYVRADNGCYTVKDYRSAKRAVVVEIEPVRKSEVGK